MTEAEVSVSRLAVSSRISSSTTGPVRIFGPGRSTSTPTTRPSAVAVSRAKVDYSDVCDAVSRVVSSERYQLLERLASRIVEVCRADPRVVGAVVEVRKMHPPVRALVDFVAVRVER